MRKAIEVQSVRVVVEPLESDNGLLVWLSVTSIGDAAPVRIGVGMTCEEAEYLADLLREPVWQEERRKRAETVA